MVKKLSIILASTTACALAIVLLDPTVAYAQRAGQDREGEERETRRVQAMSTQVSELVGRAVECIEEEEDLDCALRQLERIQRMQNLNETEVAYMWNIYGYVYTMQENFPEAIRAYENVLQQEEIPPGIETQVRQTLVQLYFEEERFEDSLAMLQSWIPLLETPQPQPYIIMAQIYYQLQRFREGIPPVHQALDIARERDVEPQESWYQLLNVFYFELEDYDNSIDVLHILARNWPKKEYVVTLGALYGQRGEEDRQLALWESAYEAGWLDRDSEIRNLASMLMQANIPYKAAKILEQGLESEVVESTEQNWRMLAQAWQMAQEFEKAVEPLRTAARIGNDGELHLQLATSFQNLYRWDDCVDSAREALRMGGLRREDTAQLVLGNCLTELDRFEEALQAFRAAARDERSRRSAQDYMDYVAAEQDRRQQIQESLAALQAR